MAQDVSGVVITPDIEVTVIGSKPGVEDINHFDDAAIE